MVTQSPASSPVTSTVKEVEKLNHVNNISLYSCSLLPTLVPENKIEDVKKESEIRPHLREAKYGVEVNPAIVEGHAAGHFSCKTDCNFGLLNIKFEAKYFILFSFDAEKYSRKTFEALCVDTCSRVVWGRFRDICALTISQSGWQFPQLPLVPDNIEISDWSSESVKKLVRKSSKKKV